MKIARTVVTALGFALCISVTGPVAAHAGDVSIVWKNPPAKTHAETRAPQRSVVQRYADTRAAVERPVRPKPVLGARPSLRVTQGARPQNLSAPQPAPPHRPVMRQQAATSAPSGDGARVLNRRIPKEDWRFYSWQMQKDVLRNDEAAAPKLHSAQASEKYATRIAIEEEPVYGLGVEGDVLWARPPESVAQEDPRAAFPNATGWQVRERVERIPVSALKDREPVVKRREIREEPVQLYPSGKTVQVQQYDPEYDGGVVRRPYEGR